MLDESIRDNIIDELSKHRRLNDIFLEHLPTKQGHNYNPLFERHFEPIRLNVKKVLEIGIEAGTSLRLWRDYFPNAEIHGFDIDNACRMHEEERIKIHIGDQLNNEDLLSLPNDFDIIIDDGMHSSKSQINSFKILFKEKLSTQGIYVVEDVIREPKVLDYFNKLSILCNYWPTGLNTSKWSSLNEFDSYLSKERINEFNKFLISNTLGVSIYRHIIFIDKGQNPQQGHAYYRLNYPEKINDMNKIREKFIKSTKFTSSVERYKSGLIKRVIQKLINFFR